MLKGGLSNSVEHRKLRIHMVNKTECWTVIHHTAVTEQGNDQSNRRSA